ncbi:MAG: hypothetical protein NTW07_00665, partial [candidate division Zixibacteria bacterium]|nr:hypothetical protein [candidate division Zixibacteria bacterium]
MNGVRGDRALVLAAMFDVLPEKDLKLLAADSSNTLFAMTYAEILGRRGQLKESRNILLGLKKGDMSLKQMTGMH